VRDCVPQKSPWGRGRRGYKSDNRRRSQRCSGAERGVFTLFFTARISATTGRSGRRRGRAQRSPACAVGEPEHCVSWPATQGPDERRTSGRGRILMSSTFGLYRRHRGRVRNGPVFDARGRPAPAHPTGRRRCRLSQRSSGFVRTPARGSPAGVVATTLSYAGREASALPASPTCTGCTADDVGQRLGPGCRLDCLRQPHPRDAH